MARVGALPQSARAPVAIVFDYETAWFMRIQPQGDDFRYCELVFRWYEAVRGFGLDVDFVPAGVPLIGYAAVVVPTLSVISAEALAAFAAADGVLLFGARSGAKTRHFRIPDELPPGPLQRLLPLKVTQVASLRPGCSEPVEGPEMAGTMTRWREWLETDLIAVARFSDGAPAIVGDGRRFYVAGWPERDLLDSVLSACLGRRAGLELIALPGSVRLRRRGDLTFAFNYGDEAWITPAAAEAGFLLGEAEVGPQQVACWRGGLAPGE
jgi:beta-galactosidase